MVGKLKYIMKKIILTILFTFGFLISCESDSTSNVSKVTNYAQISLNGESLVILTQGDTYTEEGGTAMEGETEIDLNISGTVNTAIPNVYKITYSAVNIDGFPATKTRTVIVLSSAPSAINLEGTFARNNTNINIVTRLSDRKYMCDNAAGYTTDDENNLKMIFYNIDDTKVYAPYQENASDTGISAESNVGTIEDADNFSWVIYASSFYGTATRIFIRK
ncbi:hypothetical protein B6A10_10395 [Flavobacterium sp. L1I52]|uniref:Pesticidal crystal protein Cry22Aa Ig-like domain-containing protein n=2 Tax=Flavobacterium pokkalii TaxID=1940408 RepID=A0ABR7UU83_9FLAO|nr:hypothetical protein [Flavobacterium pokkalii]